MSDAVERTFSQRLARSFDLFDELLRELPEGALTRRIPNVRSNPIGHQLWCVVGARESYARAIRSEAWQGFACSLDDPTSREAIAAALATSRADASAALADSSPWSAAVAGFALDLIEHEAAHQGQLIRYLYALDLPIPTGWRSRYSLSP